MAQKQSIPRNSKTSVTRYSSARLSILSIVNMVLALLFRNETLQTVVEAMNAVFMPIFFADFCYRFFTARSKSDYFLRKFGWADLLSSLPFPNTKILRLFRLWRVIRLMRNFGLRNLWHALIADRAGNALFMVMFLVFCVWEFGALASTKNRERLPKREHRERQRRAVVGLRHDHHRRLRRPLSGDQCRPHRWRLRDDRRRGPVRHPQRVPGQHLPHHRPRRKRSRRRLLPTPATPRPSSPSSSGCSTPRNRPPPTSAPSWTRSTSCSDQGWPSVAPFWVWPTPRAGCMLSS